MNIAIIYWSGTGNTEKMAELIQTGLLENNHNVELLQVNNASLEHILSSDTIIMGCPSMGVEVLEEYEFQPFYDEIKSNLAGKRVELFGSYGWGEGQWMEDWKQDVLKQNAYMILEPLIFNEYPNNESEQQCIDFGKRI